MGFTNELINWLNSSLAKLLSIPQITRKSSQGKSFSRLFLGLFYCSKLIN